MKLKVVVVTATLAAAVWASPARANHVPPPDPSQSDPYFHCLNDATDNEDATPWFNNNYNGSWELSRSLLDQHIPQGLTTWGSYYGAGQDLLVYTAYSQSGGRARIQGIDPRDGSKTNFAQLQAGTHAGGVAIVGSWAFVPGANDGAVRRYKLSRLADIFAHGPSSDALDGAFAGDVVGTGFLTQAGNTIYAGTFNPDGLGVMRTYSVDANGDLHATSGDIQVPKKTQGLLVLPDYFVFSTSYGRTKRSNIYVVKRGYSSLATSYNNGNLRCVRIPTMSEGLAFTDGRIYQLFESGADCYRYNEAACASDEGTPDRVITNLHRIPRATLIDDLPVYRG
jgi:hypothetical protein